MEESVRKGILALMLPLLFASCAQYKYADKIKMVSFDDNVTKGKSVGSIQGKDCTWMILGYWLGGQPTLDKAFINAKNQAGFLESAGMGADDNKGNNLRYINNVSTENEGFNAGIVGKNCLVVNGVGYQ